MSGTRKTVDEEEQDDDPVDEASKESFPASDPPAIGSPVGPKSG